MVVFSVLLVLTVSRILLKVWFNCALKLFIAAVRHAVLVQVAANIVAHFKSIFVAKPRFSRWLTLKVRWR